MVPFIKVFTKVEKIFIYDHLRQRMGAKNRERYSRNFDCLVQENRAPQSKERS